MYNQNKGSCRKEFRLSKPKMAAFLLQLNLRFHVDVSGSQSKKRRHGHLELLLLISKNQLARGRSKLFPDLKYEVILINHMNNMFSGIFGT